MKNNKLIAEFMDANTFRESVNEDVLSYEMYGLIENIEDGLDEKHFFLPSEMKYHQSWDWLMPVVKKCRIDSRSEYDEDVFWDAIQWSLEECSIENTYDAVVKFIKQ